MRLGRSKSLPARGVLIVCGCFEDRGGLQGRLLRLAEHLAQGRKVTVLTWAARARPRLETRGDGMTIVTVPSLLDWGRDHPPALAAVNTAFSLLTGLVSAWLLRSRWSIAVAAGLQPEGLLTALAARRGRRFVITTWLVGPLGNVGRLRASAALRPLLGVLRSAQWFVPQTQDAAVELIELGLPPERIRVVAGGVDLQRFRPGKPRANGSRLAVYTGRYDLRQKKLDVLIEAWRAAGMAGWELVLAGAGPDLPEVERLTRDDCGIRLMGWQDDVVPLLRRAELFVLPTVAETNAFAMLEAMACAVPGIVSATAGLAARRPAGVLLVPNQVPEWRRALETAAELDVATRRNLGEQARAWVEAYADRATELSAWDALLA